MRTFTGKHKILNQLPFAIGYKDLNSVYTAGNQILANYMGYASDNEIIGLKDSDVKNDMAMLAEKYIQQDEEVLKNGRQQHIDIGFYNNDNLQIHLSSKDVVIDNNKVMGTVYSCMQIENTFLISLFSQTIKKKLPVFIKLGGLYNDHKLSKREAQCLFYLIRHHSAKQIAARLQITAKTVETYIKRLKHKFNCQNIAMLVEKTIAMGFLFNIPADLLEL